MATTSKSPSTTRALQLNVFDVPTEWKHRTKALDEHYDTVLSGDFDGYEDGVLRIGCRVLTENTASLLHALQTAKFRRDYRTGGMRAASRIFGYRPREPLRKDFCAVTSMAREQRPQHDEFCKWATIADRYYRELSGGAYERHRELSDSRIHKMWRMHDTVFTSGIANKMTALDYHEDRGNFPETWNAMMVFTNDIRGGLLVIPRWRVALQFDQPSIVVFPAQDTLHGVTKITKHSPSSYRYSIVYYSLKMMANCGTPEEELGRIRRIKTDREMGRSSNAEAEARIKRSKTRGKK